jgi:alkanesulfonate monooxygenase SsuD/methylene tetrahydromethanopterin reductase-like flavin-dependent oxidoreductase (luciferase family)
MRTALLIGLLSLGSSSALWACAGHSGSAPAESPAPSYQNETPPLMLAGMGAGGVALIAASFGAGYFFRAKKA